MVILGIGVLVCLPHDALADTAQELLERYEKQARREFVEFQGFSAAQGRAFYFGKHPVPVVGEVGCVSCHLQDPRRSVVRHRTKIPCRACHVIDDAEHADPANAKKRKLEAFAPVANPHRFTDPELVEKWFRLNCNYVLKRPCTVVEKGNLVFWLLSLERGDHDNKPDVEKEYDFLLSE